MMFRRRSAAVPVLLGTLPAWAGAATLSLDVSSAWEALLALGAGLLALVLLALRKRDR